MLHLPTVSLHHLHTRKRIYKNLETYPNPNFFKRNLDYVMVVVAVAGPLALLPQVLHIFQTQDASSLSLITWGLFCSMNLIWIVYGLVHKDTPILITHSLFILLNGSVAYGIWLYH